MRDLLDPRASAEAGRRHGQTAARTDAGALAVDCRKLVPAGARTAFLLVPGVFRMDVRCEGDNLEVFSRALHPRPVRFSAPRAAEPGDGLAWSVEVDAIPRPIHAEVTLHTTISPDRSAVEIAARADLSHAERE